MASYTAMDGRSGRLSQFTLDRSDADFAHHSNNTQDSDEEDFYINDTPNQDFVLEFDRMMDWRYMLQHGGLGHFLSTRVGRTVLNVGLFATLFASGVVVVVANRFIIWGPYLRENYTKETRLMYMLGLEHTFAHPLITAWLQLVVAYVLLVLVTSIVAFRSTWLKGAGLLQMSGGTQNTTGKVARSHGLAYRSDWKGLLRVQSSLFNKTFMIGFLVAVHVGLTTHSMVQRSMPDFVFGRVGAVPLSLLFSMIFSKDKPSRATIVSGILATIGLAFSTHPAFITLQRGDMVWSVMASGLIALIPINMVSTYQKLLEHSQSVAVPPAEDDHEKRLDNTLFDQQGLQAYLHLANHTVSLAITLLMPALVISGEINSFVQTWSTLPFYSYWMLVLVSGIAGFVGFMTTIVLAIATSPLSTAFIFVPQASLLWPIMLGNRLIPQIWLFLAVTWVCCAWFVVQRSG